MMTAGLHVDPVLPTIVDAQRYRALIGREKKKESYINKMLQIKEKFEEKL